MVEQLRYRTAKGYLRPEEREFLRFVAKQAGRDGIIVNIGTEHGASLVCLRTGNENCHIVGIDLDNTKAPIDLDVQFVTADSAQYYETAAQWMNSVSVLFIDGDHTYEGVKADIQYASLVKLGGYMIFHDCYDFAQPVLENGSRQVHLLVPGVTRQ